MASFEGFRRYARLMPDDDDVTAVLCFEMARTHAIDAGIPSEAIESENDAKLDLYIYALALHEYESRGFSVYSRFASSEEQALKLRVKMRTELVYKYRENASETEVM